MKDDHRIQFELERALGAHQAGDLARAARGYRSVLKARPRHFDALHLLGVVDLAEGRLEPALRLLESALAVMPGSAEALSNRSIVLLALGRNEEALADADAAIAHLPGHGAAHNNRGNALVALARFDEALAAYDAALKLAPELAEAWSGRSVVLIRKRRLAEAQASAERALALNPRLADAWCNLGLARHEKGDVEGGLAGYARALAISPAHPDALYNRGVARHAQGDFENALVDLEAARRIKRFDGDDGQILHTMMNLCLWRDLDAKRARLADAIVEGALATTPFNTLGLFDDPALHLRAARTYVSRCFPETPFALARRKIAAPAQLRSAEGAARRMRVAYLSADFRGHPTSYLFIDALERHDRGRFETIALSIGRHDETPFGIRVRAAFDRFIDARDMGDEDLASCIAELEVDLLVDLMGHTQLGRPGVLARRRSRRISLAIQARWARHTSTTSSLTRRSRLIQALSTRRCACFPMSTNPRAHSLWEWTQGHAQTTVCPPTPLFFAVSAITGRSRRKCLRSGCAFYRKHLTA